MEELAAPLKEVFNDLRQKWQEFNEQEPLWDVVMGFVSAVDWKVGPARLYLPAPFPPFLQVTQLLSCRRLS